MTFFAECYGISQRERAVLAGFFPQIPCDGVTIRGAAVLRLFWLAKSRVQALHVVKGPIYQPRPDKTDRIGRGGHFWPDCAAFRAASLAACMGATPSLSMKPTPVRA